MYAEWSHMPHKYVIKLIIIDTNKTEYQQKVLDVSDPAKINIVQEVCI